MHFDPSPSEFKRLMQRSKGGLRGILDDTFYVWDAGFSTHDDMRRGLALGSKGYDLFMTPSQIECSTSGFHLDSDAMSAAEMMEALQSGLEQRYLMPLLSDQRLELVYGGAPPPLVFTVVTVQGYYADIAWSENWGQHIEDAVQELHPDRMPGSMGMRR